MIASWRSAWEEFVPFLAFPVELRKVVYTTNAIESLNARFRRAVRHRGHFPNDTAALKVLYLVATAKHKNRENLTGKINGWKTILNTLSTHYGDRIDSRINQPTPWCLHKQSDRPHVRRCQAVVVRGCHTGQRATRVSRGNASPRAGQRDCSSAVSI
jgi:hypothetical protein